MLLFQISWFVRKCSWCFLKYNGKLSACHPIFFHLEKVLWRHLSRTLHMHYVGIMHFSLQQQHIPPYGFVLNYICFPHRENYLMIKGTIIGLWIFFKVHIFTATYVVLSCLYVIKRVQTDCGYKGTRRDAACRRIAWNALCLKAPLFFHVSLLLRYKGKRLPSQQGKELACVWFFFLSTA